MTDKELAQAVEAWGRSHKDEMIKDLIDIVNFRSVSMPGDMHP